ncbi:type II toxin-antitoxin system MqsA family antitoxin [Pseudomonas xantholysinigenes]|jgi:HTH-type transcriptional regulator / antitoxin MqsA|uniref:Type II toxin-antitoxin system MqsA family antitoxin n=1 Tax=Pseudomonas xantholysinigenes TaxID=2745490 RepID=A0A9E6TV56_9PSED|nr:type II toxin-antitoxin system MqsA family antitoxin [Pseudomonas xantholysinigenes]QXI36938.1 type II toxin-antitoxin system MqsA family antitoxin [Pseudomonas xantholysinigenes]
MKCPICGAGELVQAVRDLPHTYKGESMVILQVEAEFCPACDEAIMTVPVARRVNAEMRAFNQRVNASVVDPGFIAAVRRKFDLDQREAGEIFGGGVNAFSRYENGKTKPPLALIKLFKLLDRHPELFEEVRTA